jgi:hypothetical protein
MELLMVPHNEAAAGYSPQIIPYLALPPACWSAMEAAPPAMFHDDRPLVFKPGSYLAAAFPAR